MSGQSLDPRATSPAARRTRRGSTSRRHVRATAASLVPRGTRHGALAAPSAAMAGSARSACGRGPIRGTLAALLATAAVSAIPGAGAQQQNAARAISPCMAAPAQTAVVEGHVRDASSGAPLPNAWVTIAGTATAQVSNSAGRFRLEGVPEGPHVVEASLPGYETARETVVAVGARTTTVNLALVPAAEPRALDRNVPTVEFEVQARAFSTVQAPAAFNTESYRHLPENDFRLVGAAPLSTFSIDIDRASYANVRRFIQSGERPPVDAVRIEEMINYFPYSWEEVQGEHPFSVGAEVGDAPWKPSHRLVRIGMRARAVQTAHLPPSNLVFLLDVSGSMSDPNKLPLLKKAFALLVEQLRPQDRVAVVVYAGAAGLVLPSTPGDQKAEILATLDRLNAGGSTAGGAGIHLAYETAREHRIEGGNNRVVLATDGDFNVGPSSDGEMVRLVECERESGTFLTVLGFGTGNLKDSKMEQLAGHGNGNYHYVDNLLEAKKVLVEEMGGTLLTLAKDVKIQVEFNPRRVAGYRLVGYENRLLDPEDFADDTKDAGELGAGHAVTALYEVVPAGQPVPRRETEPLRYRPQAPAAEPPAEFEDELMFVKVRYKDPDGAESKLLEHAVLAEPSQPSADFRFATAVAAFGMILRESPHAGTYSLDEVIRMASRSRGADERGYRAEFVRLVETVRDLGLLRAPGNG